MSRKFYNKAGPTTTSGAPTAYRTSICMLRASSRVQRGLHVTLMKTMLRRGVPRRQVNDER